VKTSFRVASRSSRVGDIFNHQVGRAGNPVLTPPCCRKLSLLSLRVVQLKLRWLLVLLLAFLSKKGLVVVPFPIRDVPIYRWASLHALFASWFALFRVSPSIKAYAPVRTKVLLLLLGLGLWLFWSWTISHTRIPSCLSSKLETSPHLPSTVDTHNTINQRFIRTAYSGRTL